MKTKNYTHPWLTTGLVLLALACWMPVQTGSVFVSASHTLSIFTSLKALNFLAQPDLPNERVYLPMILTRPDQHTLTRALLANDQDAYQSASFYISGDNYKSDWVGPAATVLSGWIFPQVQVPPGAMILSANVRMRGYGMGNSETARIAGFAEDSAAVFAASGANRPSTRPVTAASVDWTATRTYQFQWLETPDLSSVIQEIVNRPGWAAGNNLGLKLSNPTGKGSGWAVVDFSAGPLNSATGKGHSVILTITWMAQPPTPTATPTPTPTATPSASDLLTIPAGSFQMGCSPNDTSCDESEKPLHTITLSAYAIDTYEVTNARYAACVTAGSCTPPAYSGSYTRAAYYGNPAYNHYPVIWVNWNQAAAFCTWEGKRLPTEAEWEKAARGSSDIRIYPWGDQKPDCTLVNADDGTKYCVGDTSAIGSYPTGASPYGAMDMAGNVWEWVNDWYNGGYYGISPVTDPPGPDTGVYRVLRGGTWYFNWTQVRTSYRYGGNPAVGYDFVGFRCAQSK